MRLYLAYCLDLERNEVSMGKNQHVTHRADGKWQVKGEGNTRATFVTKTQKEAIAKARKISQNQKSELFIHAKDNKIRERDSHGKDSKKSKG